MKKLTMLIVTASVLTACTSFDENTSTKNQSDTVIQKAEKKLEPKAYREVSMPFSDKRLISKAQKNI